MDDPPWTSLSSTHSSPMEVSKCYNVIHPNAHGRGCITVASPPRSKRRDASPASSEGSGVDNKRGWNWQKIEQKVFIGFCLCCLGLVVTLGGDEYHRWTDKKQAEISRPVALKESCPADIRTKIRSEFPKAFLQVTGCFTFIVRVKNPSRHSAVGARIVISPPSEVQLLGDAEFSSYPQGMVDAIQPSKRLASYQPGEFVYQIGLLNPGWTITFSFRGFTTTSIASSRIGGVIFSAPDWSSRDISRLIKKVDFAPNFAPAVAFTAQPSPSANAAGWNNSNITVSFYCADTCTDVADNMASVMVAVISIYKTSPTITAASPAPNAEGWNNTHVCVTGEPLTVSVLDDGGASLSVTTTTIVDSDCLEETNKPNGKGDLVVTRDPQPAWRRQDEVSMRGHFL
jgi:hypothetical protein